MARECDETAELMELFSTHREFSAYGPSYWAVIAVFAIGAVLLVWIGRKQTESQGRRLGRILGVLTAAIYGAALIYSLIPPSIDRCIPLHLTDFATVAAAYALWSQRHWPFALTYYWGLVLSTQALISPDLHSPDFPHSQFLGFWAIHLLVVWAAIYLTWGRRMRPRWRSYRFVVVVTVVWTAVTFAFNSDCGNQLWFPQWKACHRESAGRAGPVAGVPAERGHASAYRVGPDDLAVGADTATDAGMHQAKSGDRNTVILVELTQPSRPTLDDSALPPGSSSSTSGSARR